MDDDKELFGVPNHKEKQPWWNDGDKMGGLSASILLVGLAIALFIIMIAVAARLAIWILG